MYRIPPIDIVKDSVIEKLLLHHTSWGEATIIKEGFDYSLQNDGVAFFSSRGSPYSSSTFYKKLVSLIQNICGNDQLKIGPRLLRHLLADSSIYDDALPEHQGAVSFLAGHSKRTEEKVYRTPVPSAKTLNAANAFCYKAQLLNASRLSEKGEEDAEGSRRLSSGSKGGKPLDHRTSLALLDPDEVHQMSAKQRHEAFQKLYGAHSGSSNQAWLFKKLTGETLESAKKRRRVQQGEAESESDF